MTHAAPNKGMRKEMKDSQTTTKMKGNKMPEDRVNKYILSEKMLKWLMQEVHYDASNGEPLHEQDFLDRLLRHKRKAVNPEYAKRNGLHGPCYISLSSKEKRELCRVKR